MMENRKNVPELRFSEFGGEWIKRKLGDVAKITTGSTPSTSVLEYYNGKKLFVSPFDIQKNRYVFSTKTTLTELGFSKGRKILKHSVLFVSIGSTIGKVGQVTEECLTNQQINALTSKEEFCNDFIFSLLDKNGKKIKLLAGVQAVPQINKSDFSNFKFFFPALPEQQKIASFLTALDDKLQALKKKKELLELYKKGVMQKIFSQEVRFKDEGGREFPGWEEKFLGEVCEIKTGNKDTQNKIDGGKYPFFVRSNTIERINSYSFDGEAILTSGDGVGVGKNFHYINGKFDFHQRVYSLRNFDDNYSGKFIFLVFSNKFYERVIRLSAKNSVDSVRMEMISKMPISFPSLPEQTKIASFLTALDEKIEVIEGQIEQTEAWKKGLLQKMFV